ncbi:hypothetical protein DL93DRAFT_2099905 [Clavulina sp. PMI_390]|nr:hypothetical protein DL93DRAFT_2099905 [Clavulina sp. PMI_390]
MPFIWRQVTVGTKHHFIGFINFMNAHPQHAVLVTSLSFVWREDFLPMVRDPVTYEDIIDESSEPFHLFQRAAVCLTQLTRLRIDLAEIRKLSVNLESIPTLLSRVFASAPIRMFAIYSFLSPLHPQSIVNCMAWRQTLTHFIVNNSESSLNIEDIQWPCLPQLKCLVTHDIQVATPVVLANPQIRSLYVTSQDGLGMEEIPYTSRFLITALDTMGRSDTGSQLRKAVLYCRGPYQAAHFGDLLQAVRWENLEDLTLFMDYKFFWPGSKRTHLAEYVVAELSSSYFTLITELPNLVALRLRTQDQSSWVCAPEPDSSQLRAEAASHLAAFLCNSGLRHPRLDMIEIRCQGVIIPGVWGVCTIEGSFSDGHEWEVNDSLQVFGDGDDWDERTLYNEDWSRKGRPDYFDSRVPLHTLHRMLSF